MVSLTWGQVNAWRLSQQGLSHRVQTGELLKAVSQTLGVHAMFSTASNAVEQGIARETERLGQFLNSPVSLEFIQD